MKITLPLKQLRIAVKKASVAALTQEAQDKTRKLTKPTDSCVKISADEDGVNFESSSQNMSVLHSVPKESGAAVEQCGCVCVEAWGYLKLLQALKSNYSILIYDEYKNDGEVSSGDVIQPSGIIRTIAIKNKAEKRKVKNDIFPVEGFTEVDYNHNGVMFSIKSKLLREGVNQVVFAAAPKDSADSLGNVAVCSFGGKVHVAGTDGEQCAIVSYGEMDCVVEKDNQRILVDAALLRQACEPFDADEIIDVIGCGKHVIFSSGNTKVRLSLASEAVKRKFPGIASLLKAAFPTSMVIDRLDLLSATGLLGRHGAENATVCARKGESDMRIEEADSGKEPDDLSSALVKCGETITRSLPAPVLLKLRHMEEGGDRIRGQEIKMSFSKDFRRIKMESTKDSRFVYFFQALPTPNANAGAQSNDATKI